MTFYSNEPRVLRGLANIGNTCLSTINITCNFLGCNLNCDISSN